MCREATNPLRARQTVFIYYFKYITPSKYQFYIKKNRTLSQLQKNVFDISPSSSLFLFFFWYNLMFVLLFCSCVRHAQDRALHHPQTLRPPYDYPPSLHVPPPAGIPQQPQRYLAEGTDWCVSLLLAVFHSCLSVWWWRDDVCLCSGIWVWIRLYRSITFPLSLNITSITWRLHDSITSPETQQQHKWSVVLMNEKMNLSLSLWVY